MAIQGVQNCSYSSRIETEKHALITDRSQHGRHGILTYIQTLNSNIELKILNLDPRTEAAQSKANIPNPATRETKPETK
jgi:hypothetical protein